MEATIDLNDVSVFVSVVDSGSFTKAAKQLGVPKSSVSRRIASLEETLGVRLLQRTTRKLSPTDAGVAYYEHASRALGDLREGASAVSELRGEPRGTLRVTAPPDFGVAVLANVVAAFARRVPTVHVEMELGTRRVDLVAEGFDLALRAGKLGDSSLVARRVGDMVSYLYAAPGYVNRRGMPKKLEDLAKHDIILFRAHNGKNRWTLDGPNGANTIEVTGTLSGDDFQYTARLALAEMGIALLPAFMCFGDAARDRLVRVIPDYEVRAAPLHIVYPSARHLPAKTTAFRDFVLEQLRGAVWMRK